MTDVSQLTAPDLSGLQALLALCLYTAVTSVTPGPNNMMVLASGVNFGIRRTLPHIAGISFGFAAMVVIMGMGLGMIFDAYPVLNTVLRWVGGAYLLYLAWKIAGAAAPEDAERSAARPLDFIGAAAFQWVNPRHGSWRSVPSPLIFRVPPRCRRSGRARRNALRTRDFRLAKACGVIPAVAGE